MISTRLAFCIVMLPFSLMPDPKPFGIISMSYLAKEDISTSLEADITTLL